MRVTELRRPNPATDAAAGGTGLPSKPDEVKPSRSFLKVTKEKKSQTLVVIIPLKNAFLTLWVTITFRNFLILFLLLCVLRHNLYRKILEFTFDSVFNCQKISLKKF